MGYSTAVRLEVKDWKKTGYDMLVLPLFEDNLQTGDFRFIDEKSGGILNHLIVTEGFKGEKEEIRLVFLPPDQISSTVLLIGLGKVKDFSVENWRRACGLAGKEANKNKSKKVGVKLPEVEAVKHEDLIENAVVGFQLGAWQFFEYRTVEKEKEFQVEELVVIAGEVPGYNEVLERGKAISEAVILSRNLAHHPGNVATPSFLERQARKIAEENSLAIQVFTREEAEKMGMGGLAAVSKGSDEPARFILLEYRYSDEAPWIGLVGKGLTFDSGGISLKPGKSMDEMKYDMCGGAAVLGVMKLVGQLKPAVNVVAAVPSTENLPGGKSYKPGDIIRAYNGKTVEIKNTDAEGRLILMDGLSYLNDKYSLNALIDVATLTGAIVVALGHEATGLFSNNTDLIARIKRAADKTGERVWEFPLWEEFSKDIKSEIADIKNIGSPGQAGSITAAAFLKEFVGDTPWAHLDIAGTAWRSKDKPYEPAGPTGAGVRTLFNLIENFHKND